MKILFICASVDVHNAVIGDTLDRAETIAKHPKVLSLSIISLHGVGQWRVRGIQVYGVGSDQYGRLRTLFEFLRVVFLALRKDKPDFFYLYMCPTLAPLLIFFRLFFGVKIVQWFGHAVYTKPTRIALKYFSDLWFNSNKSMATFAVDHLRLVGQGVKADQFTYDPSAEKKIDLITVGRITPIKKMDQILEVLKLCRDRYGKKYSLNICGDAFVPSDLEHKAKLKRKISEYDLEGQVTVSGMVSRDKLPNRLQQSKVFLFLVKGGVGKAILEGIACGTPVVISTPEAQDFFGDELSPWFLCENDNESIAKAIMKILEAPPDVYQGLSEKAHRLFLDKYTMEKFVDRIVNTIDAEFR